MADVDPDPRETPRSAPSRSDPSREGGVPPLDAVDSRWWYWIAAYPLSVLLLIPVIVVAGLLFVTSFAVVGPETGPGAGPGTFTAVVGLLIGLLVLAVVMLASVLIVMFPIALYMDARAVTDAGLEWTPGPLLYYLYRRHEHVGVP